MSSPPSSLRRFAAKTLDLLLPPLCLSCDAPVAAARTLCADCWSKIHFIAPPFCACCGAPFDIPAEPGTLCGACIDNPPHFTAARAAMLYDDASKRLVLSFKHSDRTHPSKALASWIARAGQEALETADYILPVPLHRWRLFKRRYNQAALLAQGVAEFAGKPALMDMLQRIRPTPTQGHLGRKQRLANVHGAFAVNPRHKALLKDKTVILIDDVLTTGATVNECCRLLRESGAAEIYVLTLARVRGFL